MKKLMGEFRPPRELVGIGAARVTGPGLLELTPAALVVEGRVTVSPPVPRGAFIALGMVLILVGALVPSADRVVFPLLLLGTAAAVWLAWRAEYGLRGRHDVPWSSVEHVARLPSDPDVVAIVLAAPVAGRGSPEQLYFAASNGVDALVESLREHGPAGLSMDVDSALRAAPPSAEE